MHELNLPDAYFGSNSFNISDLTPFSAGLPNLWMNSLSPREHHEDIEESVRIDQAQPPRGMTRSMTQDTGLPHPKWRESFSPPLHKLLSFHYFQFISDPAC